MCLDCIYFGHCATWHPEAKLVEYDEEDFRWKTSRTLMWRLGRGALSAPCGFYADWRR